MQRVACYVGGGFLLDWFLLPVSIAQGTRACGTLERSLQPKGGDAPGSGDLIQPGQLVHMCR